MDELFPSATVEELEIRKLAKQRNCKHDIQRRRIFNYVSGYIITAETCLMCGFDLPMTIEEGTVQDYAKVSMGQQISFKGIHCGLISVSD